MTARRERERVLFEPGLYLPNALHPAMAGDTPAPVAALADQTAPRPRRAPAPLASTAVPTGIGAAVLKHIARFPRHTGVHVALVSRARLPLVLAARAAPLAGADVSGPEALLANVASVLLADREALARPKEALLAAIAKHNRALMAPGLLACPTLPRYAAAPPAVGAVGVSACLGHVLCVQKKTELPFAPSTSPNPVPG